MPSSISNSKSTALAYVKGFAVICAALVITSETCSSYLLRRNSVTYRRISQQYAEALRSRRSRPGKPSSVLMVGNSLLLDGVDVSLLQKQTSDSLRIYPVFLEGTAYYDWSYGVRRLFRQGARPQVVVLGLDVNSFVGNSVRQEYSPMVFFDARDIFGVASDLGLDRTATSNLLLAHASTFWDTRSVIRTQILRHIVPNFQSLFSLIKPRGTIPLGPDFEASVISRLQGLRALCGAFGARLIILVPPTPSSENAVRRMALASQTIGVDTLVPVDPAALSLEFYQSDATHLNSEGRALFTSALATALPEIMAGETVASQY